MDAGEYIQKDSWYGSEFIDAIRLIRPERPELIESILHKASSLLIFADDGAGKSNLALQMALQATLPGTKLFGEFEIKQASNILYCQMERPCDEAFERAQHIQNIIPFDAERFIFTTTLQGCDLLEPLSSEAALTKIATLIAQYQIIPDIMVFDPIYAMVREDLAKAYSCNCITGFLRKLHVRYGCAFICTSHTNRGARDPDTKRRIEKDMYGNRFLSAFFTGSYHVESKDKEGSGTTWKLNKNSLGSLEKTFGLNFDPETYSSWIDSEGQMTKVERLESFIMACYNNKKTFTFEDMMKNSQLSRSGVSVQLGGQLGKKLEIDHKGRYNKNFYRVKTPQN